MASTDDEDVILPALFLDPDRRCTRNRSRLRPLTPPPVPTPSGDAAFTQVARDYLDDTYRRQPTLATFLGIHKYNEYTMGKLMILKLREDYKAKMGAQYSLQKFHDTFIGLGPLPLPLIRKAMLGEAGQLF